MAENNPLLDRANLEKSYGNYTPPTPEGDIYNKPFVPPSTAMPSIGTDPNYSALSAIENGVLSKPKSGKILGGSISRSLAEVTSKRYDAFVPGDYNNEDAYAQGQGWGDKMVNAVGKGLLLTGTTFLQSTAGLVNGVSRALLDGRAASFYDNEMNRSLDEFNKKFEDILPNYYTDVEKNARWYSPAKLFSANFLWDGIVKNMGFAAGAALSGGLFAKALSALPLTARLFSVGKAAEALQATEQGLLAANKVADTYGKVKGLSDKFLSSYNILNPGGRALVAGLATTGEAGFEAFHNLNEFRDQKIQEYKETYGKDPIGADLEAINIEADGVGNSSFLLNTALLTATNYIQFPKILGSSYTAEKGMINSLSKETREIVKDATGKFVEAPSRFGKVVSAINAVRPYTFSAAEGFEEGAQFAIGVGAKDYYDKKYKGQSASFAGSLMEGVSGTIGTDEGMENILIGGLSGSLMTARGKFAEGTERVKNTVAAIQAFNKFKLSDFTKETIDSVNRGTVLQEEREEALRRGDVLASKDLEADYVINYLTPRIKYGRGDLVSADIAEMTQLASTDEGFAQLQAEGKALATDTRIQFLKRVQALEATAKDITSLYQSLTLRYGNMVDEDDKAVYSPAVMDKMLYAASKVTDYDRRLQELEATLALKGVDTISVEEEVSYQEELKKIESGTPIGKEDTLEAFKDLRDLKKLRKQFLTEYDEIKKAPENFKEVEKPSISPEKLGQKIETEEGEEPLEVGTEYYVEREVEVKETDKPVRKYSRFTVLKEEGDEVLVQTPDGKKFKISKDKFKGLKTFKVSSVGSENAVVFLENTENVFTYNKGKGKDNPKGRILYQKEDDSLWFISFDGKDKIRITREDLIPGTDKKTGKKYDVAKVYTTGKLTEKAQAALKVPVTVEEKLAARNRIVVELYNENKASLEDLNRALTKAEKKLEEKISQLKEATYTKKGSLRKETNSVRTTISTLITEKQQIEKSIEDLKNKKESLEGTMSYLQDLVDNVKELPQESKELLSQLKEDVNNLDDLIESTQESIERSIKLLVSLEDAIKSAFKYLDKLVSDFRAKNPNIPMDLDALQSQVEVFLGEKGAEEYIKNREGFTQVLLDFQDLLAEQEKELKIPILTKQSEDLLEKIETSIANLKDLKKEQLAKEIILEKFQAVAEKFQREQAEQERLRKNESLRAELLGSADPSQNIRSDNENYEPESKKTSLGVVTSSKPVDSDRPHHVRANKFGINFQKFSEQKRNKIKTVLVSAKNEAELGLKGLTQYLIDQSDAEPAEKATADPNKTVVMVMVMEMGPGKKPVVVDENGEEIPVPSLENAIYQVMPDPALKWGKKYGEKSMFRTGTPQEVIDHYTKQYSAWVSSILTNPSMDMYSFDASFGRPDYVMVKDAEGKETRDYDAVVTAEEAGLIDSKELSQKPVIKIPATNTAITIGAFTFNSPLGRPLLMVGGVAVPLQNRKLTSKEAATIYKAILQLAKIVNEKGSVKGEEALRVIDWLKSIIYWGKPKNAAGYNSVFFESTTEGLVLKMSGKDVINIPFTKDGIERNKAKITALLEGMYNNVQSGKTDKAELWGQPYYEIIDFKEDGTPEYREWDNYQTYLLSREGRKDEEIPLHTGIRPLKDENDVNRKSVYFTLKVAPTTYSDPITSKLFPIGAEKQPKKEEKKQISEEEKKYEASLIPEITDLNVLNTKDFLSLSSENMLKTKKKYEELKLRLQKLKELKQCLWKI